MDARRTLSAAAVEHYRSHTEPPAALSRGPPTARPRGPMSASVRGRATLRKHRDIDHKLGQSMRVSPGHIKVPREYICRVSACGVMV
jgi:hypothetical protein